MVERIVTNDEPGTWRNQFLEKWIHMQKTNKGARRIYTLRNLSRLVRDVENWYDIVLYHMGLRRSVVARFRCGVKIGYVPEFFQVSLFSEYEDPFEFLGEIGGRDVVDIGASIGDTAMYFSIHGAKRVIALEPFPRLYQEALKNLALNKISNVTMMNKGLGAKQGGDAHPFRLPW